jgi:hypothetical protein
MRVKVTVTGLAGSNSPSDRGDARRVERDLAVGEGDAVGGHALRPGAHGEAAGRGLLLAAPRILRHGEHGGEALGLHARREAGARDAQQLGDRAGRDVALVAPAQLVGLARRGGEVAAQPLALLVERGGARREVGDLLAEVAGIGLRHAVARAIGEIGRGRDQAGQREPFHAAQHEPAAPPRAQALLVESVSHGVLLTGKRGLRSSIEMRLYCGDRDGRGGRR